MSISKIAIMGAMLRAIDASAGALIESGVTAIPAVPPKAKRRHVTITNMSPDQIAERDRPVSRQERRQMERLAKKGRTT